MKFIEISDVGKIVKSNSVLAIGGFTINRKPMSIVKEISRSKAKDLSVFTLAGSIDIDTLLKNSKIRNLSAAYVGYEGLGSSKLFRKAVESGEISFEDLTEILYYFRLKAGSIGVPFIPNKTLLLSDIIKINSACEIKKSSNEKENFCEIKAINPDFSLIHAQKCDKFGNIYIQEPDFSEKEMAMASKITIFSVEEIGELNSQEITIPKEFVDYIVVEKNSASPTGCNNHYPPKIREIIEEMNNE